MCFERIRFHGACGPRLCGGGGTGGVQRYTRQDDESRGKKRRALGGKVAARGYISGVQPAAINSITKWHAQPKGGGAAKLQRANGSRLRKRGRTAIIKNEALERHAPVACFPPFIISPLHNSTWMWSERSSCCCRERGAIYQWHNVAPLWQSMECDRDLPMISWAGKISIRMGRLGTLDGDPLPS